MQFKLKKIRIDASLREFFRLYKGKKTSIIVKAKKEIFFIPNIFFAVPESLMHAIRPLEILISLLCNICSVYTDNILAFVNKDKSNISDIEGRDIKIINWDFRNINDHKDYVNEIIKFKPNIIINSAAIFGPENQKYYSVCPQVLVLEMQ